ncbi:hypothetical protein [Streptomyces sp. NPDC006645]|uniref:wHTH domain-containing protein n=1 Tax=unclassified Streptomyces TaxID=2593676 RepID=UPI00339EA6F2
MPRKPDPAAPESQDPDDLVIASSNLNGRHPWQDPAEQVPYGRVLLIAAKLAWRPDAVLTRLGALGYADVQRSDGPWPDAVGPDDVPLIAGVDRRFGALPVDADTTVSLRQIVVSAALAGRAPAEAARRMTALGFRVGTGARPLPESANPRDVVLIRKDRRGKWFEWGDEVPAGHVLEAAQELSCSPRFAAERLIALGLRLPYTPEPDDERLLKYADTPGGGWISRWATAPVAHVLAVARETGRPPADIVARLAELGCQRPDGTVPDAPEPDDFVLLSENLDGRAPWLAKNTVVGLQLRHILRASLATGKTPAQVTERLTALGHWLHERAILPETAEEADIRLLAAVTNSYLDIIELENVLRTASLAGRSPADVAARMRELGYWLSEEKVAYPEVRPGVRAS